MLLSSAIHILNDPLLCKDNLEFATHLLGTFVRQVADLYGQTQLVYNMHVLVHLSIDVQRYGCLDNYSCFPSENYMQILKKLVRCPNKPLSQVIRRASEISEQDKLLKRCIDGQSFKLLDEHHDGPVT